jgi:hypothetical protein
MSPPDPRRSDSPAALTDGAAGEGAPNAPAVDREDGRTIELALSDLEVDSVRPTAIPDEIGPTVGGIPIRNQLAAARIAHAISNAREAQALMDEAVELLATVRGLHAETYQLGAAVGTLRETADVLARHASAAGQSGTAPGGPLVDLKNDPSYEEIAIWVSFGIPVTS